LAIGAANLIQPTIEALADPDLLLVTAREPAALANALLANLRIVLFIPHRALLPLVDVMVTNADYNGVLTALAYGVPLVCAGHSEHKAEVSACVA
jgi:UDP:flavonoid glycosyltransferase YjiC (YdhE family)